MKLGAKEKRRLALLEEEALRVILGRSTWSAPLHLTLISVMLALLELAEIMIQLLSEHPMMYFVRACDRKGDITCRFRLQAAIIHAWCMGCAAMGRTTAEKTEAGRRGLWLSKRGRFALLLQYISTGTRRYNPGGEKENPTKTPVLLFSFPRVNHRSGPISNKKTLGSTPSLLSKVESRDMRRTMTSRRIPPFRFIRRLIFITSMMDWPC